MPWTYLYEYVKAHWWCLYFAVNPLLRVHVVLLGIPFRARTNIHRFCGNWISYANPNHRRLITEFFDVYCVLGGVFFLHRTQAQLRWKRANCIEIKNTYIYRHNTWTNYIEFCFRLIYFITYIICIAWEGIADLFLWYIVCVCKKELCLIIYWEISVIPNIIDGGGDAVCIVPTK